jgi:phage gp29-like protein
MATRTRTTSPGASRTKPGSANAAAPSLDSEIAHRLVDPFETLYMGVIRTSDPLLLERGGSGAQAFEIYRDLRRDGKVYSGLERRRLAVIARPWQVTALEDTPRGQQDAKACQQALQRMGFDRLVGDMLESELVGFGVNEIVWTYRDGWYVPARAPKRAQRRFRFVQDDPDVPPQLRLLTRSNMLTGEEMPQRKFVVHRINPDDDNPYGTGLGLQLYWPVYFKRLAMASWNKLNDRFGLPVPWGRYPGASGPRERATLFDALRRLASDKVLMTPDGAQVELLESKLTTSGTSPQQAMAEFCDDWIMEVLLGQSPRGKSGGAQAAAANERESVRLEISQASNDLVCETLNNSIIGWMCELNGWVPLQVGRTIKADEDLKARAETDKIVSDMGFELEESAVQERYGQGWRRAAKPAPTVPPIPGQAAPPAAPAPEPKPGDPAPGAPTPTPSPSPSPARQNKTAEGNKRRAAFAEPASAVTTDPAGAGDAIAQFAAAELQDWERLLQPLVDPISAAISAAVANGETAAQLLRRLGELQPDVTVLASSLEKAMNTATLVASAGVPTTKEA